VNDVSSLRTTMGLGGGGGRRHGRHPPFKRASVPSVSAASTCTRSIARAAIPHIRTIVLTCAGRTSSPAPTSPSFCKPPQHKPGLGEVFPQSRLPQPVALRATAKPRSCGCLNGAARAHFRVRHQGCQLGWPGMNLACPAVAGAPSCCLVSVGPELAVR